MERRRSARQNRFEMLGKGRVSLESEAEFKSPPEHLATLIMIALWQDVKLVLDRQ